MYNGFCESSHLYEIEISKIPVFYKSLLITSHEFAHVLDGLSKKREIFFDIDPESFATYYGTYFSQCGARVLKFLAEWTSKLIENHPISNDLEKKIIKCTIKQMDQMENYFVNIRSEFENSGKFSNSTYNLLSEFK